MLDELRNRVISYLSQNRVAVSMQIGTITVEVTMRMISLSSIGSLAPGTPTLISKTAAPAAT